MKQTLILIVLSFFFLGSSCKTLKNQNDNKMTDVPSSFDYADEADLDNSQFEDKTSDIIPDDVDADDSYDDKYNDDSQDDDYSADIPE